MKRYVIAGASNRAYVMFVKPIKNELKDFAVLEGIFDTNPVRSEYIGKEQAVGVYYDFEKMLEKVKPHTVIVTTVDAFHHEYIVKALEAGCDVITEKPMTIDAEKVRLILEAEKRSGKKVYVTFNYRYSPFVTRIKELMRSDLVGQIYSVDFEWLLDRNMNVNAHGASYFRRWNRYMKKSGGLLVHKSTHHFDLVNWWIEERPVEVSALGKLRRYGANGSFRGERCLTCNHKKECEFYKDDSKNDFVNKFYMAGESIDGYYIDGCVYAEDIDIYDTMSVNVLYDRGAILTYSLNAHSPYEGWRIAINGSKGRLEAEVPESGILSKGLTNRIKFFDMNDSVTAYDIPIDRGDHGGGDVRLRRMLFVGDVPDPLGHQAGSQDGAYSVLTGAAANVSIAEKRVVDIAKLLGDESLLRK